MLNNLNLFFLNTKVILLNEEVVVGILLLADSYPHKQHLPYTSSLNQNIKQIPQASSNKNKTLGCI